MANRGPLSPLQAAYTRNTTSGIHKGKTVKHVQYMKPFLKLESYKNKRASDKCLKSTKPRMSLDVTEKENLRKKLSDLF